MEQEDILDYYQAQDETINELDKFDARFALLSSLNVSFNNEDYTDEQLDVHTYTLKLSESWFLFETLLNTINERNYNKIKKEIVKKPKKFKDIRNIFKYIASSHDETDPYGKADIFDESKISDEYLKMLLESEIDIFTSKLSTIFSIENGRTKVQEYLLYLAGKSKGFQKEFLSEGYNNLTNSGEVKSKHIMAISYAVRNQYVHDGELINSGIQNSGIKLSLLEACYHFVISYTLIIACQIKIDK